MILLIISSIQQELATQLSDGKKNVAECTKDLNEVKKSMQNKILELNSVLAKKKEQLEQERRNRLIKEQQVIAKDLEAQKSVSKCFHSDLHIRVESIAEPSPYEYRKLV